MRFTKKIILGMALLIGLLSSFYSVGWAQSSSDGSDVVITFFWREGCSHCAAEKPFLQELADKFPQIDLKAYEVYYSSANRDYLLALGDAMGFEASGVPVTIIGDQVWIGFGDEKALEIESAVEVCLVSGCPDVGEQMGIDKSDTLLSMEVVEEESSSFPVWIIPAAAIILLSYAVGVYQRKKKMKSSRKKH